MSALDLEHPSIAERVCCGCGVESGEWWWFCLTHNVWECDGCSYPYEGEAHRFNCERSYGVHVGCDGLASIWCVRVDDEDEEEAS